MKLTPFLEIAPFSMTPFLGVLLLTIRITGAGWVWSSAARDPKRGSGDRCGWVAGTGLIINLLLALIASAFQQWSPGMDWILWGVLVCAGAMRIRLRPIRWASGIAPALAVGGLATAAVLLPLRSEWLAGGWDPGLYQNYAVSIAQRGGTQPRTDTVYAELTPAERETFRVTEGAYNQVFPGVPIDLRDGSLPIYFFPLNSICGAWLHRLGGLALLTRASMVLALLGLLPAYALLGSLGLRRGARLAGLLFWGLSPLWVYHQAIAISEMLQLFLFSAGLLFYLESMEQRRPWPLLAGLALFAGTVNRFDYPVFAGLLLALAAGAESAAQNPGWRRRILFCFGALALGILWDWIFAWVTISRLQEKDQVLWVVLLPFAFSAGVAWLLAWRRSPPPFVAPLCRAARFAGLCAAGALVAGIALLAIPPAREMVLAVAAKVPVAGGMLLRFSRLIPFHGTGWFLSVAVGAFCLARDRSAASLRMRMMVAVLGGLLLMLLLHGGIAPIYPWALRRYFVFLIPFMALAQGDLEARVFGGFRAGRRIWAAVGLLLLGLALFDGVRYSQAAFQVGDYVGISELLQTVDGQIQDRDLLVADDPRWGTPLLLARGRDVLDGKRIWGSTDPAFREDYLRMLRRLQREEGRRVLWLTSTEAGLGLYPLDIGPVVPMFENLPFVYRTVVHSARADHFQARDNRRAFGLYEWTAESAADPLWPPPE
jgi:hypothetical protein